MATWQLGTEDWADGRVGRGGEGRHYLHCGSLSWENNRRSIYAHTNYTNSTIISMCIMGVGQALNYVRVYDGIGYDVG